jgi:hypothetical protein
MPGFFFLMFVGALDIIRPRQQSKDDIVSRRPLPLSSEKERLRLLGLGAVHLVVLSLVGLLSSVTPKSR